jgi:type IV secretion system protein VirD4
MSSSICVDPKGENAAITARARKNSFPGFGHNIHIINPWGEMGTKFEQLGFPAATYNPLDILDRDDPNVVATAQALAAAICPGDKSGKDAYWNNSAASVLTAVLLWLTDQPGETKTLGRAREIVTLTRQQFKEQFLAKMAASSAFEGAIRENAAPFIDLAAETYSGVMSNLAQHTKFLSDPQVKRATATSSFSMKELMTKLTTVYLVIPPDRMDTQRTWLRLLITAGMQTYKHRAVSKFHRCMFLIDEFPALGRLDEVPRDIATMAGYGVDFTLIIQGIDQLKEVYGQADATILSNCAFKPKNGS